MSKLTIDSITDEHIEALKSVAYAEGNMRLVRLCYAALIEPQIGPFVRARLVEVYNSRVSELEDK